MARLLWWVLLYYFDVVFYLLQIFCTSGFEYDQKVVENYLHAPVISIATAIGSPEKTRCSVEGKIAKVNDCDEIAVGSVLEGVSNAGAVSLEGQIPIFYLVNCEKWEY